MRLLFVTPYYYPEVQFGGPPKRIHALSQGLAARGHDVHVVAFHSGHPKARHQVIHDGITVQYMPWLGTARYQIPIPFGELEASIAWSEIVHCYGLYNLLCPLAARSSISQSKPFLIEPMGMYVPRVRAVIAKRLYNRVITRWMAKKAAAVVATSPLELDELKTLTTRARLVLRRNGVNIDEYQNLPSRDVMRGRWGLGENETAILYVGRIDRKKNLEQLVLAFERAALPAASLVIAGPSQNPGYLNQLEQTIASTRVADRIKLEGPIYGRDYLAALAAADLFVLPSLNENFGNSAAEAVAAGVPVLLTNTCGIAPLIHGRAGLAVPLGIDNLANGLKAMMPGAPGRSEWISSREQVLDELSLNGALDRTEAIYTQLLSEAAGVASEGRQRR